MSFNPLICFRSTVGTATGLLWFHGDDQAEVHVFGTSSPSVETLSVCDDSMWLTHSKCD